MDNVTQARWFAAGAHGDQRYGDARYIKHLDDVAEIVKPYGASAQVLAYLHDVIEDTHIDYLTVRDYFGVDVAEKVRLLTDEGGPNRKSRKEATNAKLRGVGAEHQLALIVKAADRLANVRAGGKNDMYRKEHTDFGQAVYRHGLCDPIWEELNQILGG